MKSQSSRHKMTEDKSNYAVSLLRTILINVMQDSTVGQLITYSQKLDQHNYFLSEVLHVTKRKPRAQHNE